MVIVEALFWVSPVLVAGGFAALLLDFLVVHPTSAAHLDRFGET